MPVIEGWQSADWRDQHISLWRLRRGLHIGFHEMMDILAKEDTPIYRIRYPSGRCFSYVTYETAFDLERRYGSAEAHAERMERSPGFPKNPRLKLHCPHCSDAERQWRNGMSRAGGQKVQCGRCGRYWVVGRRRPLVSKCPGCGETTRQLRCGGVNSAGNRQVRCGHCKTNYTLDGDPDEEERRWLSKSLGMPIPVNWWTAEWQMKPISEWPGYEKAVRRNEARNRRSPQRR